MNKEASTKIIAVVALALAIVGVTVGFAAFSNTLTISSEATVTPDEDLFDVNFSSTDEEETDGAVIANPDEGDYYGNEATIDNSDSPTIRGLKANFTAPGQEVTYSFFAHNAGEYNAYLNAVTFANVGETEKTKVCTPADGTTKALVDTACEDISVKVKVKNDEFITSNGTVSSHMLAKGAFEPVVVTIAYKTNENINIADGDFDVAFGDITLTYGSVD